MKLDNLFTFASDFESKTRDHIIKEDPEEIAIKEYESRRLRGEIVFGTFRDGWIDGFIAGLGRRQ